MLDMLGLVTLSETQIQCLVGKVGFISMICVGCSNGKHGHCIVK